MTKTRASVGWRHGTERRQRHDTDDRGAQAHANPPDDHPFQGWTEGCQKRRADRQNIAHGREARRAQSVLQKAGWQIECRSRDRIGRHHQPGGGVIDAEILLDQRQQRREHVASRNHEEQRHADQHGLEGHAAQHLLSRQGRLGQGTEYSNSHGSLGW